ncbi:efflux RND transporter permease subunit [Natronogracilivirga saccharolytica]|uniref:Efflux RND transporter permease subunit n=1 Tax=Natronogracilivirga saccharolytica TaxID=2812953 RepID=A0A8J7UWC1_9BACT|nr:efflux RND transporter permease subunit [Natronogracilivirga saccharolytica]MBP3192069.1 efflux RND transporter permease subunit [Natronogracilivirga saccharolytica]
MTSRIIRFFLENKLIALLLFLALAGWGIATAPFDWDIDLIPRDPVPVDAIPDIGDNQQIIFSEWSGRSPQDIEDQITYPLTTQLLGIPGVRTIRSNSMFGFSSINIIFEDDVEFYWSRARILEKLNALPGDLLPDGVQPALGPDATALGQIFWYTLEGHDADGNPTGGWDPQELRSIQDFQVRYALSAVEGVAEVASIGGFVKEYQVDIDPDAMREAGVTVSDIADAVRSSNLDIGARTIEMNRAEYVVRGLGYIQSLEDLEESVVAVQDNTPIRIKDVAHVGMGPAQRRGALDKAGADAVGGVVVARYGENPLEVIQNVKEEIETIAPGLPSKELDDGTVSQVEIVPFYDRTGLIYETLGTLEEALSLQILITIIVIIIMVMHLRTSLIISLLLPLAVLMSFIMMKYVGVDANVVALAGIAISIGTVVDMGIILTENMLRHIEEKDPEENMLETIYRAVSEVSPAVITALMTTIVSFLPVFMLEAQEGRLFGPLAFTKTFILIAALVIVITLIPAFSHWLFSRRIDSRKWRIIWNSIMIAGGVIVAFAYLAWAGIALIALGANNLAGIWREEYRPWAPWVNNGIIFLAVAWLLAGNWLPLGPENPVSVSLLFILLMVGVIFGLFWLFMRYYERILDWSLRRKTAFLTIPLLILLFGAMSWQGFDTTFRFVAKGWNVIGVEIEETRVWSAADERFPGLGQEFMPTLDEGSFLLMPTTMPHAGIEETLQMMREMDMRIASIPEVETVVGKIGRVESALDPAPISMFENVIMYKSEYKTDERGRRVRYKVENGAFVRDDAGELIPDRRGRYYRQWRDHIHDQDDIWTEILHAGDLPGVTSAPKLQPIETRLIMLQTGMRANMGVRVSGPDLETIDEFATSLEPVLRQVEGVRPASVFADRVVGKPYLEIAIDRQEIARHGLTIRNVQEVISTAIGGQMLGMTVEGRERYPLRARYAREYRDNPDAMKRILIPAPDGSQIPLGQLAEIRFETGPMNIRSENTFLNAYVTFDAQPGEAPVDVVNRAQDQIDRQISEGNLSVPDGISYVFEGEFQNQKRAAERLSVVLPITLLIIFLIIYFQFRSSPVTMIVFSGIILVWAGGFVLLWLYGQDWFFNFSVMGTELREFFQMGTINMSVAVWVGFLALFGIAVDNGVVMATYLEQLFERKKPGDREAVYATAIQAGMRRVRPCLMTTGTTLLALMPILTSPGKGSEIMIPMAIPIFGGMLIQVLSLLLVPLLYALWKETTLTFNHESKTDHD